MAADNIAAIVLPRDRRKDNIPVTMSIPADTIVKKDPQRDLPTGIIPYMGRYWCEICALYLNSKYMMNEHADGKKHKSQLSKLNIEDTTVKKDLQQGDQPTGIIPFRGHYKCEICDFTLTSNVTMTDHVNGKRHKLELKYRNIQPDEAEPSRHPRNRPPMKLSVDQNIPYNKPSKVPLIITTDSADAELAASLDTQEAADESRKAKEPKLPKQVIPFGTKYRCEVCKLTLDNVRTVEEHVHGKRHLRASIMERLKTQREYLVSNKYGIKLEPMTLPQTEISIVEKKPKKGVIQLTMDFQDEQEPEDVDFTIHYKDTQNKKIYLHHITFLRERRFYKLISEHKPQGLKPLELNSGDSISFSVRARPKRVGRYHTTLVLQFKYRNMDIGIPIIREIHARAVNEAVLESDPRLPYIPPPRISMLPNTEVIDGQRPKSDTKDELKKELELKNYGIPMNLRKAVNQGVMKTHKEPDVGAEALRISMLMAKEDKPTRIRFEEYHKRLSALLHIEELQMEVDIRTYDLKGVTMRQNGKLLELKVPGLAENRPSVMRGDSIFVRIIGHAGYVEDVEYKGYVHRVQLDSVLLGFSGRLMAKFIDNMRFDVRFTFNRLPLKLQHRATELAVEHGLESLLFPQHETICTWGPIEMDVQRISFYDRKVEQNAEQANAVRHIVAGSSRPAPYLIFGPPGTGKTVTIVEAIKQVIKCLHGTHVLACAPSNSAADLITQRLLKHVKTNDIFRMHAASRSWNDCPEDIKGISNFEKGNHECYFPPKEEICKKKIVVVTLVTAGRLVAANFPQNHFTHIFIDEAGHAFESEAVIPIAGILESNKLISRENGGLLVMAGDPKQLGPIVRSPSAKEFGLEISLLERLMDSKPYQRCDYKDSEDLHYNPCLLTKLVDNYRSHPAILDPPNKLFYDGELKVCADKIVREAFCQWSELPTKGFPIIFHGVVGQEEREGRSPSFFNPEEINYVISYVEKLMTARGVMKLQETDVGVIAPYQQQVVKIRAALRKRNYKKIKVGSVEEFQGQERMVIIISSVRSRPEYLEEDAKCKMGFLANKKKYNVATTRAKALMIIVGNPEILQLDEERCWNKLIDHCMDNNAYIGHHFVPIDIDLEELDTKMSTLQLGDYFKGAPKEIEVSDVQHEVHPAWRGPNEM